MDHNKPKPTRIVCDPSGIWTVQQLSDIDDNTYQWLVVYQCNEHHDAGYYEAKKWMEENL